MRKIDAFAHILPRSYLSRLERQLEKTMAPSRLDYYREGVFSFDPVLTDLDVRWRKIEPYGDYAQVLVLAVPPLEEVGTPEVAAEFARIANDEMAELVQRFGDRFAGNVWKGSLMLSSCLFPSLGVRLLSPIFAVFRRRCCTGCCTRFAYTAVFEKRMEARIRRSFPEGARRLLCRSPKFALVLIVRAPQCADVRR
jgi:hypothetical protein